MTPAELVTAVHAAAHARQGERLAALGREALERPDFDANRLTVVGIELRDREAFSLADAALRRALAIDPTSVLAARHLALSLTRQARHAECIAILERLLGEAPGTPEATALLAHVYYLTGQGRRVAPLFRDAEITAESRAALRFLQVFGAFVEEFPLERAMALVAEVERAYRPCGPPEVIDLLLEAKRARAPFALLRLGDGEGSYTRLDLFDEARYAELYADNRAQFYDYWFGTDAEAFAGAFAAETRALARVIGEADMLGVPHPNWIRHEYGIGSTRGISALVNVYRLLAREAPRDGGRRVCSQMIHLDLGGADVFRTLLEGESIGLISCFPGLPDQLKRAFGAASVAFHKLPGEQYFKDMIGEEATDGLHYPDVFERVMADLAVPHRGKVFLVAGGILGKLYIGQIRRYGGIAVDIGSLADAWVKKATRPGYDQLGHLALAG